MFFFLFLRIIQGTFFFKWGLILMFFVMVLLFGSELCAKSAMLNIYRKSKENYLNCKVTGFDHDRNASASSALQ